LPSEGKSSGNFLLFKFALPFGDRHDPDEEDPEDCVSVGDSAWLPTRLFLAVLLPGRGDDRGLFLLLNEALLSVLPSLS
jgi:hypothetical protein